MLPSWISFPADCGIGTKVYLLLCTCESTHAQERPLNFGHVNRGEAPGVSLEQNALQQLCTNQLCPKREDMKDCTQWSRTDEHLSSPSPMPPLGVCWPPLAKVGPCEGLHPVLRQAGSPLPHTKGNYVPPHHRAAWGHRRRTHTCCSGAVRIVNHNSKLSITARFAWCTAQPEGWLTSITVPQWHLYSRPAMSLHPLSDFIM